MYLTSKKALEEERKFLAAIGEESWPENMNTNKENLLRTTVYDEDLESNSGNDSDVLPELWESFRRKFPGIAKGIEARKKNKQATSNGNSESDPVSAPRAPPSTPLCNDDSADSRNGDNADSRNDDNANSSEDRREDEAKRTEEEKLRLDLERLTALRVQADKNLLVNNICVYDLNFEEFARDVWNDSSMRVDLVLSSVPSTAPLEVLSKLPAFCKTVLKTGSYVFLIVSEAQFIYMQQAFNDTGFKVCDHPFNILYDTKTLRKRKSSDFPQRHCNLALVAKTQGIHPNAFSPDFASSNDADEKCPASYASFLNVENCTSKLKIPGKNSALYPEEKSVELFTRIIRLLAPIDGSTTDPIGGPLTSGLACLQTDRSCTIMEKLSNEFRFALGRLRVYATPDATMEHHSAYTDILDMSDEENGNSSSGENQVTKSNKRRFFPTGDMETDDTSTSFQLHPQSGCERPVYTMYQSSTTTEDFVGAAALFSMNNALKKVSSEP